jgi:hypothetical protein
MYDAHDITGSATLDLILERFGIDPADVVRSIWRRLKRRCTASGAIQRMLREDGGMPKVDEARRIQQFRLGDKFQETFDAWAEEVEKKENGTLVITHEEIVHDGVDLIIFYRIDPKPHVSRSRR